MSENDTKLSSANVSAENDNEDETKKILAKRKRKEESDKKMPLELIMGLQNKLQNSFFVKQVIYFYHLYLDFQFIFSPF